MDRITENHSSLLATGYLTLTKEEGICPCGSSATTKLFQPPEQSGTALALQEK